MIFKSNFFLFSIKLKGNVLSDMVVAVISKGRRVRGSNSPPMGFLKIYFILCTIVQRI